MYNNNDNNYSHLGMNIPISGANIDGTGMMLNERVQYTVRNCTTLLSTANTNLDGTGALETLITGGMNGTMIKRITIKARGTTTQGMIRFYLQQTGSAYLIKEVEIPAVVQSAQDETLMAIVDDFFYVEKDTVLKASTEKAESFVVYVESTEFAYFSPKNLTSLIMWFKSDSGITKDGSNYVSQWDDLSGSSHHLLQSATGGVKPLWAASVINSLPAIQFDGTNDFINTNDFTTNQPFTVFIIFTFDSAAAGDTIFDGRVAGTGRLCIKDTTPTLAMYGGKDGGTSTDMAVSEWALVTCIFNGTGANTIQVNNHSESSGNGTASIGGFYVGTDGSGGSNYSQIQVAEIIVMNAAATATERANVKSYVSSRYNITM